MHYIQQFIDHLHIIGYDPKTIQNKKDKLLHYKQWLRHIPILAVNTIHIKNYYQHLCHHKAHCSKIYLNYYMVALNQFYEWCHTLSHIQLHPFGNFTPIKDTLKKSRTPIAQHTIKKWYADCQNPIEKLILIFAYGCGMRTAELQHLKVADIHIHKAIVIVQSGKFNKKRTIPIPYKHIPYIAHYTRNLAKNAYLFSNTSKTISQNVIRSHFKNLQQRSTNKPPQFTIHHLRHSIASHLVDNGVVIQLVQHFLGHASLKTTQQYVTLTKTITYD